MKLSMMVLMTSCAPRHALSAPAMAPTSAPPSDAGGERQRHGDDGGQATRRRAPTMRGGEGADGELPFGADVEEAGAQRERHGQAGEDERRRLEEHLADAVAVAPGAGEEQAIDGERRAADGEDQRRGRGERDQRRPRRRQRSAPQPARRAHVPAPSISAPISRAQLGAALGHVVDAADDAAAIEHADAVGEREQLVEIGGDEQHRLAGDARVRPARRGCARWRRRRRRAWAARRRARRARAPSSRPTTIFCWLPPESDDTQRCRIGRAHVEALDDALGVARVAEARARRARSSPRQEVVGDGEVEEEAARVAIFGDVRRRRARGARCTLCA